MAKEADRRHVGDARRVSRHVPRRHPRAGRAQGARGRIEEKSRTGPRRRRATNVVDLTELLKRSLKGGGARAARADDDEEDRAPSPSPSTGTRRKPAAKTSAKGTANAGEDTAKRAAAKHGATGTHAAKKTAVRRKALRDGARKEGDAMAGKRTLSPQAPLDATPGTRGRMDGGARATRACRRQVKAHKAHKNDHRHARRAACAS